jgi:hypothetical protein
MSDWKVDDDQLETSDTSITRRTAMKLAFFVPFLREQSVTITVSTEGLTPPSQTSTLTPTSITVARRAVTFDGSLGQNVETVAMDGPTAIFGVPPTATESGPAAGRGVILRRSDGSWTPEATLTPDGDSGQFGRAVAVNGTNAVIGAEMGPEPARDHAGSAAVFNRADGEWTRSATLKPPHTGGIDFFGTAVAVAEDTVLVGASSATTAGRKSGAAHVYTRSGESWSRETTLVPPTDTIEAFGRSVDLDGDTAVIGARRADGGPTDSGLVFVYRRIGRTWHSQGSLAPRGTDRDDTFGKALATDGGTIVAGAPTETNNNGMNAGSVYTYSWSTGQWRQQTVLRDKDGGADHKFGTDVALDGDAMLIASEFGGGPVTVTQTGGTWRRVKGPGTKGQLSTKSRTSVAMEDGRAMLGIDGQADRSGEISGSVEVFEP